MATDRNPQIISRQPQMPFRAPAPGTAGPVAESLGKMAEVAVGMRQQQLNTQLSEELLAEQEQTLNELEQSSQELEDQPQRSPQDFKTLQEFEEQMNDLQAAAGQGRSGSITQLKIRQERILREYMSQYPQLRAQFNQAATGVLGYSPLGAEIRAAEAAATRGGGSGMGAITSFYMQRANELGVDTTLFLTNPELFWTDLQRKSARQAHINEVTQWGKEWQNFDSTEWQLGVANMAAQFWDAERGVNAMIDKALQAVGYPGGHLDLEEAVAQSSASGGANTIEELLPSGVYERFRSEIMQNKTQALTTLYENFVDTEGRVINGRRVAPLSLEQFSEKVAPILSLFDYAAEYAGNEYAMNTMKRFNELRAEGALADFPDYLVRLSAVNNLFGPNTTVGQMFIKGQIADEAAKQIDTFLGKLGNSATGQPTDPNGAPTPVFNEEGGRAARPPEDAARFRTARELRLNAPEALEEYDESFQQLLGDVTTGWLDYSVQENDPTVAAIAVHTITGYGNMVREAQRPGVPNNLRPTAETDDLYLAAIANPNFPEAYRIAYPNASTPATERAFESAWGIAHERVHTTVRREISRVQDILENPETSFAAQQHDFMRTLATMGTGRAGIRPPEAPKPDPDFVSTMFSNNYVEFNIDRDGRGMSYSMHPNTPKAFQDYGKFVVDMLNAGSEADRRRLAMYGMAASNLLGVPAEGALRRVMLGQR